MPGIECPSRPFLAFGDYLTARFGCKVYRVALDAGFSCPNRDGTIGTEGCIYCRTDSFAPVRRGSPLPVREQMLAGMERVRRRYGARKFLAYFQPFTNTYADVTTLRQRYDAALVSPEVVGLCIGTRPDCVPDATLDLVAEYARRLEVWLEYGLQSANDVTLARINRGHSFATFADAVVRTRRRGIKVCAHVILGLPGETREDVLRTADALGQLGVEGVKMHHLHVVRGTPLEAMWKGGEVRLLTAEEYAPLAVDFLERIPASVVVHRLVGECRRELLLSPIWTESKREVTRRIKEEFARRGTRQGAAYPTLR